MPNKKKYKKIIKRYKKLTEELIDKLAEASLLISKINERQNYLNYKLEELYKTTK